jgi:uncharacterized protein YdeI (YjbR/CyaY-like superfamily)
VSIELDAAARKVDVPDDLERALAADATARRFFDGLSFTHRKEWVRWITEAKKAETRTQRVVRTVDAMVAGRRTH